MGELKARQAGIFADVRVIDLGRFVAGPYAASILADLGAEVIRVEPPVGGDDRFKIPVSENGDGANYIQLARNKKSLTLDYTKPEGRVLLDRLIATSDVLIANVPPDVLTSMKLDYATLRSIKPDIILATATAYGTGGPYSDHTGFDVVAQCMSGAAYLSGDEDKPHRSQAAYCDYGTALYLAIGIIAALRERERSGQGQQVETSLLHTGLAFVGHFLSEQAVLQTNRRPSGNQSQTAAPADVFKTSDGWFTIFVLGESQFRRIAKLVGHDEWLADPRFADDMNRGVHADVLAAGVAEWCKPLTNETALAQLRRARIPCGPLLTPAEVLRDPHIAQMNLLKKMPYPGASVDVPVVDLPIRFSRSTAGADQRAPLLGEHTNDVLLSLGLDPEHLAQLKKDSIV